METAMYNLIIFLTVLFLTPFGWIGMICFGLMIAVMREGGRKR